MGVGCGREWPPSPNWASRSRRGAPQVPLSGDTPPFLDDRTLLCKVTRNTGPLFSVAGPSRVLSASARGYLLKRQVSGCLRTFCEFPKAASGIYLHEPLPACYHFTECFHQLVLESQLPHKIVDLLFTIAYSNIKFTVSWGSCFSETD